ncbi:hypothetical protein [Luteimonas sp. A478]
METLPKLIERLDALEAQLPELIEKNPDPARFWATFIPPADAIQDQAGPHRAHVERRIADMLAHHGRYITLAPIDEVP